MKPIIEIIGDADLAAPFVEWAKLEWTKQVSTYTYKHVGDCLIEFIKTETNSRIRFYTEANSGFILHPRTGTLDSLSINSGEVKIPVVSGGWNLTGSTLTKLSTKYPFPLIDSDNASLRVSQDKITTSLLGEASSYGNYYLINGDEIISWKGAPNRHAQFSSRFSIPGIESSTRSYSGFTEKIYSKGDVVGSGPLVAGAFGFIYALAFFENKYIAVIKTKTGTGLWTSTNLANNALWEKLIEVSEPLPDLPWWFDFSSGFIKAVSSKGDILTISGLEKANIAQLVTSVGTDGLHTINGSVDVLFEGSVYSNISTSYISDINISGNFDITDDTKLITRTEFLPDTVQITRRGNIFCAALANSEGKAFSCQPCPTEVDWSGPVIPIAGTSCAALESDCYPPGDNEIEIEATVTCGNLEATGSITITITGRAGYWGNRVGTYKTNQWSPESPPYNECFDIITTDLGYNAQFESSGYTPQGAYSEISGNKRYWYLNNQFAQYRQSDCPCACFSLVGRTGPVGGIETYYSTSTFTTGWTIYTDPNGTTSIYCNQNVIINRCSITVDGYVVNRVPWGHETWVCL